jgi:type I restriction enzyme S subunit
VILGVPALIDHDNKYVLNQRVGRIFLQENSLIESILILYMQMKEKNFISELQSKGNSGVQVNLGTDTIRQTKIVVPTKENQKKILPQLNSIFDKLDHNRIQVQSLENLRDTLLPKLMCGNVIITE